MATGDRIFIADKETLDAVKADTTGILQQLQDADGKFSNIKRYGVKINKADSNPATRVTYLYDAVGLNPAKMNYADSTFDLGDWGDKFFVKGNYPVMLNADGTEAYKLNPNDYSLKENGEASEVSDESTTLNAMSAFPLMWLCQYEIGNYEYIIVADEQVDSSYQADAFERKDGSIAPRMYMPIYGGSYDGAKLRSLSGKVLMYNTNATTEFNRAAANGDIWTIIPWSRRNLVNSLLTIIGKSDDTQTVFGQGQTSGYVSDASQNYGHLDTGTLDDKGQFFGYSDTTHEVKVFHMEKYWGNRWERLAGYICDKGRIKVKMRPPYNLTGADFADTGIDACKSGGYLKNMYMTRYGRFPKEVGGASSTYLCDYYWINADIVAVAIVGGYCGNGASCGASCVDLAYSASYASWGIGASLSCESPSAA
jgi:hypothetical protein